MTGCRDGEPFLPAQSAFFGSADFRGYLVLQAASATAPAERIVEIGSEMGAYNAAESGEDIRQCTALEINRVRQRLAVQIWRDYQEHITARIRYADPDADARTRLAEEMEQEEEEAEQALVRLYNEAYLQRMGRPQEFGV